MRHLFTTACLALFAAPAFADVALHYNDEDGKPAHSVLIKGHQVRMDTHDGDKGSVLFDARSGEITILDGSKREYVVLDRPTMERLQQQMRQAFEMMRQFGMDPEAMGLGKMPQPGRHVRTGETKTVGGHRCEMIRYEVEGQVESVACIAQPDRIGISASDWRTVRSMFETLEQMVSSIMPSGSFDFDIPTDGVPVETADADGGNRQLLGQIDAATIDPALMSVPAGWKRTSLDMPELPGGGGRR